MPRDLSAVQRLGGGSAHRLAQLLDREVGTLVRHKAAHREKEGLALAPRREVIGADGGVDDARSASVEPLDAFCDRGRVSEETCDPPSDTAIPAAKAAHADPGDRA